MTRGEEAMEKLRLLVAKASSESRSTISGQATSPTTTIHAAEDVTVVLTVAVDGARLARSVAIQWHHTRNRKGKGLQTTGTPSLGDGAEGVTTITYNFVADRPGTFTYHARYHRDRAAGLVDVRGSDAGPSAGRRARTDAGHGVVNLPRRDDGSATGCQVRAAARHGVVNVPRSDQGPPTADGRTSRPTSTAVTRADGRAWGRRGMASVEAQIMGNCPVIYYDAAEYDAGPPVQRLLRRGGATLAAAVLWVSGICGPSDPD